MNFFLKEVTKCGINTVIVLNKDLIRIIPEYNTFRIF